MNKTCTIKATGTFILGGKNETEATVYQLIQSSLKLHLDDASYSPLFVYPDTPLYKDMFSIYTNNVLSQERLLELVTEAHQEFFRGKPQENEARVKNRYSLKGSKCKSK